MMIEHKAWTGGTSPREWSEVAGTLEGDYAIRLHLEQCGVWRSGCGGAPDSSVVSLFWDRARHDAHATYRGTLLGRRLFVRASCGGRLDLVDIPRGDKFPAWTGRRALCRIWKVSGADCLTAGFVTVTRVDGNRLRLLPVGRAAVAVVSMSNAFDVRTWSRSDWVAWGLVFGASCYFLGPVILAELRILA